MGVRNLHMDSHQGHWATAAVVSRRKFLGKTEACEADSKPAALCKKQNASKADPALSQTGLQPSKATSSDSA